MEIVNTGVTPGDGTGDRLYVGFVKTNNNVVALVAADNAGNVAAQAAFTLAGSANTLAVAANVYAQSLSTIITAGDNASNATAQSAYAQANTANATAQSAITASGAGKAGAYLANICPSGVVNNYKPTGWGNTIGRLDLTLPSGNVTWTGLVAGNDAQVLYIRNGDTANNLTLNVANASSGTANRFAGPGPFIVTANSDTIQLVYFGTPVNNWIVVT